MKPVLLESLDRDLVCWIIILKLCAHYWGVGKTGTGTWTWDWDIEGKTGTGTWDWDNGDGTGRDGRIRLGTRGIRHV